MFTDEVHFKTVISTVPVIPIYLIMIIHVEQSKENTNIAFPSMCGVALLVNHWTIYLPTEPDRQYLS
jgi:hypothetical protein